MPFNSETARAAGKKSKRTGLDKTIQDYLNVNQKSEKDRNVLIIEKLFNLAEEGNVLAIKELWDRGYGVSSCQAWRISNPSSVDI